MKKKGREENTCNNPNDMENTQNQLDSENVGIDTSPGGEENSDKPIRPRRRFKLRRLIPFFLLGFLLFNLITGLIPSQEERATKEIAYSEFLTELKNNEFDTLTIQKDSSIVKASKKDEKTNAVSYFTTQVPSMDEFVNIIHTDLRLGYVTTEVKMEDHTSDFNFFSFFTTIIYLVINLLLLSMIFGPFIGIMLGRKKDKKDGNTPRFSFSNPFNTDIDFADRLQKSNIKFTDVAGLDEEKEELVEVVDYMKSPERYSKLGAKIPKGVLLSGPPGTGKTLLAKAVAGEAGVNFVALSGSDFVEKYVGVGASRIRNLFKEARKNAPCIIFIDEVDAVGSKREDGGNSEHNQTLEQLLAEMDGFEDQTGIVVIAATNREDCLDPALKRPGRFDRKVPVNLPDVKGREEILKIHARNKVFGEDIDFRFIAVNTSGYSGAELANLLNEAALIAARKKHDAIFNEDVDEALKKITIGLKKSGRIVTEAERKLTAVHEAGHAIVAHELDTQASIKEISIVPRGKAGGYTWQNRVEAKAYVSQKELKEELRVLLAGRVAEQLELNDISSGASNDLMVATQIAREMITLYGMDSEIGPISFNGLNPTEIGIFGEKTLSDIGSKISKILKEAESKAKDILQRNHKILLAVTDELLEKETISGEDLDVIFRKFASKSDA